MRPPSPPIPSTKRPSSQASRRAASASAQRQSNPSCHCTPPRRTQRLTPQRRRRALMLKAPTLAASPPPRRSEWARALTSPQYHRQLFPHRPLPRRPFAGTSPQRWPLWPHRLTTTGSPRPATSAPSRSGTATPASLPPPLTSTPTTAALLRPNTWRPPRPTATRGIKKGGRRLLQRRPMRV